MIGLFIIRGGCMNPKKQEEFVPISLYIEDWSQYAPKKPSKKDDDEEEDDVERGVIIIDLM